MKIAKSSPLYEYWNSDQGELAEEKRTIVFFESPHRIAKTLNELYQVMGKRKAVLARELTKIHEEVIRGTLEDLAAITDEQKLKGEITLVIAGVPRDL